MQRKFCYLYLTCEANEAPKIAQHLLEKRLVACTKFIPITAAYWWDGEIEHTDETLLVLESAEDLFGEIETELEKIHSYDTFVLTQIPMTNISSKARSWLDESLKKVDRPKVQMA